MLLLATSLTTGLGQVSQKFDAPPRWGSGPPASSMRVAEFVVVSSRRVEKTGSHEGSPRSKPGANTGMRSE